jgi:hypothetical protein
MTTTHGIAPGAGILWLAVLPLASCGTSSAPSTGAPGDPCGRITDCGWGLVCPAGVCVAPCAASDGDEACRRELAAALERYAGLTEDAFLKSVVPPRSYLDRPGFRPDTAQWFDLVRDALDLTVEQRQALARNGFVLLGDRRSASAAATYHEIYGLDLPVLVTVDAVLEALHLSYDTLLLGAELEVLVPALDELLVRLRSGLEELARDPGRGAIDENIDDIDVFLTVAVSLLREEPPAPLRARNAGAVGALLDAVRRELPAVVPLFGGVRRIDFSQFRPRSHYDCTPDDRGDVGRGCPGIDRYFRTMIWLGRTELRIEGAPDEDVDRQLVDAVVLQWALRAGAWPVWERIEAVISRFAGAADNLTPAGMERLIADAAVASPADLAGRVEEVRAAVRSKEYGVQRIASQFLRSDPFGPGGTAPARAYLLLGQRFVVDSHVFSNVVFDAISWGDDRPLRQLPDPLDVGYAALANDAAAPLLGEELRRWHHSANLAALRTLVDAHDAAFWTADVHHGWLAALRALSPGTGGPAFPRVMRTEAWARRILGTQLASWAQLRHDDMLYAKQSYSRMACSYPDAWVEPHPEAFARLGALARDTGPAMAEAGLEDAATYFRRFAEVMDSLESAARRIAAGEAPTEADVEFLEGVVRWGGGCIPTVEGWLAEITLSADDREPDGGILTLPPFSPTIADVHTAPDPGRILHVGTGWVRWMVADFDTPTGERIFVGPVLSYFERVEGGMHRLTDAEWEAILLAGEAEPPSWYADLVW